MLKIFLDLYEPLKLLQKVELFEEFLEIYKNPVKSQEK